MGGTAIRNVANHVFACIKIQTPPSRRPPNPSAPRPWPGADSSTSHPWLDWRASTTPTAVTPGVWLTYSEPELEITTDPGLFWDLVWMLRCSFTGEYPCRREGDTRWFEFYSFRCGEVEPVLVTLKATRAPGNDGQPVFTLRLPEEN